MNYTNTYTNRVAEFERQQKEYLNSPKKPAVPRDSPVSNEAIKEGIPATLDKKFITNPYETAREKILLDMSINRRKEILRMEELKKMENATYREFIEKVA